MMNTVNLEGGHGRNMQEAQNARGHTIRAADSAAMRSFAAALLAVCFSAACLALLMLSHASQDWTMPRAAVTASVMISAGAMLLHVLAMVAAFKSKRTGGKAK